MIRLLLKLQVRSILASMFRSSKKATAATTKSRSLANKLLTAVLLIYVLVAALFSLGAIFYLLFQATETAGNPELYFSFIALLISLLSIFGTIFTSQNQLFEAKDNERLLSMPILPRHILISRFAVILLTELVMTLIISIPAAAIFCWFRTPTVMQAILYILSLVLLPLFSLVIGCLLGWLFSAITARMRHKSLFYVPLFIAILVGYFFVSSNPTDLFLSMVSPEGGGAFFDYIPPVSLFGKAIANVDLLSFLYFFLWCVPPFVAVITVFSKRFIRMATTHRGLKKRVYVEKTVQSASPVVALMRKELRRFFSIPNYIINSALGVFMEVLFCGYLIISGDGIDTFVAQLTAEGVSSAEFSSYIGFIATAALTFCASQSVTTACSISLEGDRLWILKSLPVTTKTVFLSKLFSNLVIGYPTLLLSAIICVIFLPLTFMHALLLFIIPICALPVFSLLGLAINIRFPRFDWINETVAIKQSLSVFLSLIASLVVTAAPIILYFVFFIEQSPLLFLLVYLIYFLLIGTLLCLYLFGPGQKRFQNL